MHRMKKYIILMIFALTLTACTAAEKTSSNIKLVNGKPKWFWQPNYKERLGGVGISRRHVNGKSAQRLLAISRAIDEIARQKGVNVETEVNRNATVTNTSVNTKMKVYSKQYSDGKVIVASLVEFWEDNETEELYVWMVE